MKRRRRVRKINLLIFLIILGGAMVFGGNYIKTLFETDNPQQEPPINDPEPSTELPVTETTVSFSAVGDILMEEGMYNWMGDGYSFGSYFDDVKEYLKADLSFVNQEVIIGGEELGILGTGYRFNAPIEVGQQIRDLGFNVVSLANNHSNDMGLEGMKNSLAFWRQFPDILNIGMYDSQENRNSLKTKEIKGIEFGFLAYTYATNRILDADEAYRLPYFLEQGSRQFTSEFKEMLQREVAYAREHCDVLIVSMHWGPEFSFYPTDLQKELAHILNELGVDLILGHHSHGMMPIEWIENAETNHKTLVAYSLGNFVSADVIVDRSGEDAANAYSLSSILTLDFVKLDDVITIENIEYMPVVNHFEHGYTNFHLYPLGDYTEDLAANHYRSYYSDYFTKSWLTNTVNEVMDRDFLTIRMR